MLANHQARDPESGSLIEPSTTITGTVAKPSRRRSDRIKKNSTGLDPRQMSAVNGSADPSPDVPSLSGSGPTPRRSKKSSLGRDDDVTMTDAGGTAGRPARTGADEPTREYGTEDEADEAMGREKDDGDDDDPFGVGFLGGPGHHGAGISNTLRALTGMISGVSSRLREILANIKQKGDPSVQLIALQELSEILLVSTEDNLSGHFSPDQFIKELVTLMEPDELGEENPEMMLLACRCIANLMEALPSSTANVVYGGAVPVLCQKLLEIHYIDLAEQALSVS